MIEDLSADHDRSAFSCGQASLDEFLKRYAGQNQKTGVSRTYVAVRPGRNIVAGYYSISAGAVAFKDIPDALRFLAFSHHFDERLERQAARELTGDVPSHAVRNGEEPEVRQSGDGVFVVGSHSAHVRRERESASHK